MNPSSQYSLNPSLGFDYGFTVIANDVQQRFFLNGIPSRIFAVRSKEEDQNPYHRQTKVRQSELNRTSSMPFLQVGRSTAVEGDLPLLSP